MTWMLSDIASMTKGQLIGEDQAIDSVSTDSRQVSLDQLFIAIKGERFDAHDFVESLAGKAGAALVSQYIDCDLPQVVVSDTRVALADFAAAWRQQFKQPLIALTGSNGKTTVKEMLSAILSERGQVLATLGNLNNDLGMPLTLLRLRDQHDYAVIEMGANHFGEIKFLTNIAKPDVALLNNAGAAHLEGFGDIKGVSRAKAEIFQGLNDSGVAVINADDQYADYWFSCNQGRQVISFGLISDATVQGEILPNGKVFLAAKSESVEICLSLLGEHNARNALAAAAAAMAVGVELLTIKAGLESLKPVKGRLASVKGQQNTQIIDDTYNANPTSVKAAIDVLSGFTRGQRVLVLGDLGELGENALELHRELGAYAREQKIDRLFCLGVSTKATAKEFGAKAEHFTELEPLLESLKQQLNNNMTLLVKGSRSMRMERVVEALQSTPATSEVLSTC